ncbi:MAG: site-specific integrase, partial [Clostridia bacterium]|nr:site-specific integrase [Clostridia bacterium]
QHKAKIAKLNYSDLKATFLTNAKSVHTREAYILALSRLEMYLNMLGKSFAEISTLEADKFIQSHFLSKPLKKGGLNMMAPDRASASIRRDASCIGAFYSFVQRISNNEFANPFRGTRAKPVLQPVKELCVPSKEEISTILASKDVPRELRAAIAIMAYRGVRVGGLPSMNIDYTNQSFNTTSKGKLHNGFLTDSETVGNTPVLKFFNVFEGKKKPFNSLTSPQIKMQVKYWMDKLHQKGVISSCYSCHDFRHHFAVAQYRGDYADANRGGNKGDIYKLQKMLNHSSISITETYLKTLNLI